MTYMLVEILLFLIGAFLIGGAIGWFIHRCACSEDLQELQTKLDNTQSELSDKSSKLQIQDKQVLDLQSRVAAQESDIKLMTSRWQSTLGQAKLLPKYKAWLSNVQGMYQNTRLERDNYHNLVNRYFHLHQQANQKIQRLNKRVTDQETYKIRLDEMIEKVGRLNDKVTVAENDRRGLYGMISKIQSSWHDDRVTAIELRDLHPKLENEKNEAMWKLAEFDKKYTEKFNAQEETHRTQMAEIQKRINELKPLEGNTPGQDTKFNRFMDKIRLVGTNKNTVLGRTYKQLEEMKLETSEKERIFVDTCEEKDAVIEDLREQLRTADNRAQAASAAIVQEYKTKITELETKANTASDHENIIREHEHTIEALKTKLAEKSKPIAKPSQPKTKKKPKPAVKVSASKPASGLNKPAKGLNIKAATVRDDLKLIKGIGPVMEKKLNAFGVYSFEQLGNLTSENITALAETLDSFPGRIERDNWVSQSKAEYKKKYGKTI